VVANINNSIYIDIDKGLYKLLRSIYINMRHSSVDAPTQLNEG